MTNQRSSRAERLLGVARVGVSGLIKAPVREAVREALAEEQAVTEHEAEHRRQSAERTRQSDEEERAEGGNRFLKPAVLLPVLGLAVAAAVLKRRSLKEFADEKGVVDQGDDSSSDRGASRAATADLSSATTGDSTSYDADPGAIDRDNPIGPGEHGEDPDDDDFSMVE